MSVQGNVSFDLFQNLALEQSQADFSWFLMISLSWHQLLEPRSQQDHIMDQFDGEMLEPAVPSSDPVQISVYFWICVILDILVDFWIFWCIFYVLQLEMNIQYPKTCPIQPWKPMDLKNTWCVFNSMPTIFHVDFGIFLAAIFFTKSSKSSISLRKYLSSSSDYGKCHGKPWFHASIHIWIHHPQDYIMSQYNVLSHTYYDVYI